MCFGGNFTTVAWSARPHTSVFRPPTSFFRTTFLDVVCFKLSAPLTNAAIVYDESTDRKSPYTRYTASERPLQKTHICADSFRAMLKNEGIIKLNFQDV